MATRNAEKGQSGSVVERIASIHNNIVSEFNRINLEYAAEMKKLRQEETNEFSKIYETTANDIANVMAEDTSDIGKALLDMFLNVARSAAGYETFNPLQKGLGELKDLKLITTNANTVSLFAEVDTYETDPTCYVLTSFGKRVYTHLNAKLSSKGYMDPSKLIRDDKTNEPGLSL